MESGVWDLELDPVDILQIAKPLQILGIIGVIVNGCEGRAFAESFDEHALPVQVGEPQRAMKAFHALVGRPLLHRSEEGLRDFEILDKIDPTEAGVLFSPLLDVAVVDETGDSSDHASVFPRSPVFRLAKLEGGVLVFS